MTLVTRFLAARRDKLLMKLGCWLVCFSLVLGLMLPQQRAEALVAELTMASVAGVAAAYLCACGLPFVTQGMDRDALTSSIQRLINEFLSTELAGASIQDWLGNIWDVAVLAGKLVMGRPLTNEMMAFAQWVAGKYGTQIGENVVYDGNSSCIISLLDGSQIFLARYFQPSGKYNFVVPSDITQLSFNVWYELLSGNKFRIALENGSSWVEAYISGRFETWGKFNVKDISLDGYYIAANYEVSLSNRYLPFYCLKDGSGYIWHSTFLNEYIFAAADSVSLSIERKKEALIFVPSALTAEQGVALDVGAAETMDLDLVLQGVLDDVIAGALTSTMTAAGEEVVDPPVEEEIPDVDNLGLPALGQALTSRFPFSIPWDFFRAVQLLAAPAKAPYFEVDFMEPLADDVGGWQGDTTVILDFSEYAIIGQISRWTSTIGFCLMLAGATKRLI